jgi:DNA (cytosine-5)-methyltransferase 1
MITSLVLIEENKETIDVAVYVDYLYDRREKINKDKFAKVNVVFIDQQYGNSKPSSVEVPIGSLTGNPKFAIVNPKFIMNQYSSGGEYTDLDGPSSSVTNVPKQNLVSCEPFIMNTNFNNIGRSIDEPAQTLTASRRHPYIINANSSTTPPIEIDNPSPSITQRTHLIINPSWFGHSMGVDEPSCTIIARQDKSPLYLLAVQNGPVSWIVFEDDSETMIKIKTFMVQYGITDIKMRMLKIPELLQIQGFPKDYKLIGTQTEQKKYIGNAVEVNMARALAFADYEMEIKMAA